MIESSKLSVSPRKAGEADGYNSAWYEIWRQDDYEYESDKRQYKLGWDEGNRRGRAALARLHDMEARLGVSHLEPMQRVAPETFTAPERPSGAMKIRQVKTREHFRKRNPSKSKVKNKRLFGR